MTKILFRIVFIACSFFFLLGVGDVLAKDPTPLTNPLAGFTANSQQDAAEGFGAAVSQFIARAIATLAALTIIPIVVGGLYLLSSSGNPEMVKKGKSSLTWGVIGLILALSSIVIYNFLLQLAIQ